MTKVLKAGSSQVDITPTGSQFLFGYPHVARYSTGVHGPVTPLLPESILQTLPTDEYLSESAAMNIEPDWDTGY